MEGSQAENQAESWERSQSGEKVESTPAVDPARLKHTTLTSWGGRGVTYMLQGKGSWLPRLGTTCTSGKISARGSSTAPAVARLYSLDEDK